MTPGYETYLIVYEHRTESSDTPRVNQAMITMYGASELALRKAIATQRPDHRDIIILEAALIRRHS